MPQKCLQEITTCCALGRLDFYRFEATETLVSAFITTGRQATHRLRQSTMELGVESL